MDHCTLVALMSSRDCMAVIAPMLWFCKSVCILQWHICMIQLLPENLRITWAIIMETFSNGLGEAKLVLERGWCTTAKKWWQPPVLDYRLVCLQWNCIPWLVHLVTCLQKWQLKSKIAAKALLHRSLGSWNIVVSAIIRSATKTDPTCFEN